MTADSDGQTPKRDGGLLYYKTASLDYDCVVVAGSVHVSKHTFTSGESAESIPQSVPRFTVGQYREIAEGEYIFKLI